MNLLELIKVKKEINERQLYLHILARCFLVRSFKWKSPYGYPWFLDGRRFYNELIKWYEIKRHGSCGEDGQTIQNYQVVYRPDVFFSRIWELKPLYLFHRLKDEDYAATIQSIAFLLGEVEMCTKEEQEFILEQIIKYGNKTNPLYKLQQPQQISQVPKET